MNALTRQNVLDTADSLVEAFAAHDTEAYFACFAADATFVFYAEPERLEDRAAYEALWADWSGSGWRVESCDSTDRLVQIVGETAIFSHSVRTLTSTDGVTTETAERETIVFAREASGALLAVHEHLSARPAQS